MMFLKSRKNDRPSRVARYHDEVHSDVDDKTELLSDSSSFNESVTIEVRTGIKTLYIVLFSLLLTSVAINLTILAMVLQGKLKAAPETYHPGFDSPALRDLGYDHHQHFINGSFEEINIYRQKPSKEVDDAWLALGTDFGSIVVPYEDGEAYGFKEGQVKRVAEQGGGYMADLYLFHNLHCLNLIRQTSHFFWDHYRAMAYTDQAPGTAFEEFDGEAQLEQHFTHCLDMLRQEIMCDANIAVFGQWFVKVGEDGHSKPTKDFSYSRQCRNFAGVLKWFEEHRIDMDTTMVRHLATDPILSHDP